MKTAWSAERLERLFTRYNRRYWAGRLPTYKVVAEKLDGCVGLCDWKARKITIDVEAHRSDAEVRSTVLHEMAHAADTSRSRVAHGRRFWEQVEHLLRQGAPVTVGQPEMPELVPSPSSIPKEFPLSRAAIQRFGVLMARRLPKDIPSFTLSEGHIVSSFGDAAIQGLTWKEALVVIGAESGLLDVDLKPIPGAQIARLLHKARRAFREDEDTYFADCVQKAGGWAFLMDSRQARRTYSLLRKMRSGHIDEARVALLAMGMSSDVISTLEKRLRPRTALPE